MFWRFDLTFLVLLKSKPSAGGELVGGEKLSGDMQLAYHFHTTPIGSYGSCMQGLMVEFLPQTTHLRNDHLKNACSRKEYTSSMRRASGALLDAVLIVGATGVVFLVVFKRSWVLLAWSSGVVLTVV